MGRLDTDHHFQLQRPASKLPAGQAQYQPGDKVGNAQSHRTGCLALTAALVSSRLKAWMIQKQQRENHTRKTYAIA